MKDSKEPSPGLISVVVVAHQRRDFVPAALSSVAIQEIPHERIDIVVVTDFTDQHLETLCRRIGARLVVRTGSVGFQLAEGVRQSKGEIVCFLDDDDLFRSDKLNIVDQVFSERPEIGYFHNGRVVFSKPTPTREALVSKSPEERFSRVVRNDVKTLSKILSGRGWLTASNLSCVSVRRSLVIRYLSRLEQIEAATDGFFLFLAIASQTVIAVSDVPVTFYRYHQSFSHQSTADYDQFVLSNADHADAYCKTLSGISSMLTERDTLSLLVTERDYWTIRRAVYSGKGEMSRIEAGEYAVRNFGWNSFSQRIPLALMYSLGLSKLYCKFSYWRQKRLAT